MGLDDDIAILAAAPLFGSLDWDALRLLTFAAERRELADGDLLFSRGDPADGGFVVMSGTIRLEPRGAGAEPVRAGRAALIGLRETLGLAPAATLAVGDGANDLDMLTEAGLGVAFRAKPAVAAAAQVRVEHGDLSALLYLQGYAAAEFVG